MFSNNRRSMRAYIMLNPNITDDQLMRIKIDYEATLEELKLSGVLLSAITIILTIVGIIVNKTYTGTGKLFFLFLLFFAACIYFLFTKKNRVVSNLVNDIKTIEYEIQMRKEKQAIHKSHMEQISIIRDRRLREKYKK
ncbi:MULTISPECIES: hypothetical protein [unclassified Paenibacillus]|uniref:hypothetical protein n=1 Tax=unclassified Paenibacillus TaxID=185978 RepID=UPI0009700C23|nr:hypothetical protein [Paenibacillus sp. FSL H8-0259]OMF31204.1 hypothetical protein BK132_07255 [Paenibacillus sp. FSL H8-0259]